MKHLPFLAFCLLSLPATAQEHAHAPSNDGLMPAKTKEISVPKSAPAIYLGMDKSELVRLERNAASIIVGNPTHASVLMDSPNLLVVVPRAPGATYFTVLDQSGEVILQRHVIVAAPKENYIRVRAAYCGEDADECVNTKSFYCEEEGMCHQIVSVEEERNAAAAANNGNEDSQNTPAGTESLPNDE